MKTTENILQHKEHKSAPFRVRHLRLPHHADRDARSSHHRRSGDASPLPVHIGSPTLPENTIRQFECSSKK